MRGGLPDRPPTGSSRRKEPLRNALWPRERVVAQEAQDRGNSLNRRMGLAAFPVPYGRARHAELAPRLHLIESRDEPALSDMLAQGLGLEVVFPRFQALEPERDGLQKSNATLSVRIPWNADERLPLRRRGGGEVRCETLGSAARPDRFARRGRARSVRRNRRAHAGRAVGGDPRARRAIASRAA